MFHLVGQLLSEHPRRPHVLSMSTKCKSLMSVDANGAILSLCSYNTGTTKLCGLEMPRLVGDKHRKKKKGDHHQCQGSAVLEHEFLGREKVVFCC